MINKKRVLDDDKIIIEAFLVLKCEIDKIFNPESENLLSFHTLFRTEMTVVLFFYK